MIKHENIYYRHNDLWIICTQAQEAITIHVLHCDMQELNQANTKKQIRYTQSSGPIDMEMSKDPSYDQNIMCLENLIKLHLSYDKKSIWRASFFNDSSPLYSYSLKILIL